MSTSLCVCVCVCVCVSVSVSLTVRDDISGTTRTIYTDFLCMLPMAAAWSFCGVVAIRYTSGFVDDIMFFYNGPYSGMNFARRTDFT